MKILPCKVYTPYQSKKNLLRILNAYQSAIDLNIICSITDIGGSIIYVNDKFCQQSGFSEDELIGQNHNIVNSGFHSKLFFQNLWDTVLGGDIWQGEVRCKRKDGTFFWLHSIIIPIFDEKGEIVQFFSLRNSIDDKKNAEDKQKEYIKSLEEMLFMTSHHVRQPLAHILGLSSLLNDSILSLDDLKYTVSQIQRSTLSLDVFTKELTSFISEVKEHNKKR